MQHPPFLDTHKLREVHRAAEVYMLATGDRTMYDAITVALRFAESVEPDAMYAKCINCGGRVPKGRRYCGFDCAEEDGAIEK